MSSCQAQRAESPNSTVQWSYRAITYTSIASALGDMSQSMLIAFFPIEARNRGLSPFSIGILFATFHLFALLTCLTGPRIMKNLTLPIVLKYGVFLQALIGFSFSFTGQIHTSNRFFITFLCLRSVQGILSGLCEVSSIGLVKRSVPEDMVGESVVWIESSRTLGLMLGPVFGGGLNMLWGYAAPYILSASCLLIIFFIMMIFPIDKVSDLLIEGRPKWNITKRLFGSPVVCLLFVSIITAAASVTFLEPTLLPFLTEIPYNLDEIEVGLLYLTLILVYAILAGFSGSIASLVGNIPAFCYGMFNLGLGYCVIAPSINFKGPLSLFSFMHFSSRSSEISVALLGLLLIGFGAGTCLVPVNSLLLSESAYKGITAGESAVTISSIINVGFTTGAALGPIIGGALVQKLDFQRATVFFGFCIIGCAIVVTTIAAITRYCRPVDDGSTIPETMGETMAESLLTSNNGSSRQREEYMEAESSAQDS